jgi:hypothetical protein
MGIIETQEGKDSMRFQPDPEIERELVPLRAMVCLGKVSAELYRTRYHEAALRKLGRTQID